MLKQLHGIRLHDLGSWQHITGFGTWPRPVPATESASICDVASTEARDEYKHNVLNEDEIDLSTVRARSV